MAQKYKILVVEDELIIAKLLTIMLVKSGYEVLGVANNSEEAREIALRENPVIICMDIDLGYRSDYDGIATAKYLQTHLDFILIYISGTTDHQTLQRAKQLTGYHAFIKKPFGNNDLIEVLETVDINANGLL